MKIKKDTRTSKEKQASPYANINWEKASFLFQRTSLDKFSSKSKYPQVKEVLHILAGVGTVGLMLVFPGAASAVASVVLGKSSYSPWRARKIFQQLEKQKYVNIQYNPDGSISVKITKEGMTKALTYQLESLKIKIPNKWDGKWRIVIFDIPNKYKQVRDIFRMRLKQLGLKQLQESVYVSPYKCFEEIEFLRELYGVAFTVSYLLVEKIENDNHLKNDFDLT